MAGWISKCPIFEQFEFLDAVSIRSNSIFLAQILVSVRSYRDWQWYQFLLSRRDYCLERVDPTYGPDFLPLSVRIFDDFHALQEDHGTQFLASQ